MYALQRCVLTGNLLIQATFILKYALNLMFKISHNITTCSNVNTKAVHTAWYTLFRLQTSHDCRRSCRNITAIDCGLQSCDIVRSCRWLPKFEEFIKVPSPAMSITTYKTIRRYNSEEHTLHRHSLSTLNLRSGAMLLLSQLSHIRTSVHP